MNTQQTYPLSVQQNHDVLMKNKGSIVFSPKREWQFDPEGSFDIWHVVVALLLDTAQSIKSYRDTTKSAGY